AVERRLEHQERRLSGQTVLYAPEQRQRADAEEQGGRDEPLGEATLAAQGPLEALAQPLEALLDPPPLAQGAAEGEREEADEHAGRRGYAREIERVDDADQERHQADRLHDDQRHASW